MNTYSAHALFRDRAAGNAAPTQRNPKALLPDVRPQALAQRRLQESVNGSPQLQQAASLQASVQRRTAPGGVDVMPAPLPPGPVFPIDKQQAERERMDREAREQYQRYIAEHGIDPISHKIQRAQERHSSEYVYEPSAKQRAEDERGYLQARHQLRMEKQYHEDTVHGGFEQRASEAVGQVPRDKAARIVNYGEVTRQSIVERDTDELDGEGWVQVDHEAFGPHMSGRGRNQLEAGPYGTANPECADPQVQDGIHHWLLEQREGDADAGREEDRVDVQFYDDKEPCETCAHNIPAQATNEGFHLDLFLPEHADEARGQYSGARYHRSHHPDAEAEGPVPLVRRGGLTNANLVKQLSHKISALEDTIGKKELALAALEEKLIPAERKAPLVKRAKEELEALRGELQKLRNKREQVAKWPRIE